MNLAKVAIFLMLLCFLAMIILTMVTSYQLESCKIELERVKRSYKITTESDYLCTSNLVRCRLGGEYPHMKVLEGGLKCLIQ